MIYTYSIATDTASGLLSSVQLSTSIAASNIVPELDRIDTQGDSIHIVFTSALTAEEQATLAAIVGAHTPTEESTEPEFLHTISAVFPDDNGLYFRGVGGSTDLVPGLNAVDIDLAESRLINQIELWTDSQQYGEHAGFQVVDKVGTGVALGLYPQEYFDAMGEVVLQPFGSTWQLHPGEKTHAKPGYKAAIYAGLTVRINLQAVTNCKLYYNLYLHKETAS